MSFATPLRELLTAELPRLYAFAYVMSGTRDEAAARVIEVLRESARDGGAAVLAAPKPGDVLLSQLARHLEDHLGRKAEQSFVILDNLLRSELTRPIDLDTPGIDGDLGRVHPLLWELKRTCLTSVLGCLPPAVRLSFIVTDLLGYPPAAAAEILGIKESAFRVRLTRARKRLEDYLTPRCYHIDRQNPCNCEGRLGIALEAGFLRFPPHTADIPAAPYDAGSEQRDVGGLYRNLPRVQLSPAQLEHLLAAADLPPPGDAPDSAGLPGEPPAA